MRVLRQKRFIISFLRLTRVWNLIILALSQLLAAAMLVPTPEIISVRLFLLIASTGLIAGAGYIINDYYDVKIDLVNKPERVVIGQGITRRYALLFHTILSVTGVAIGFLLKWQIGIINFAAAFLLWWYSNDLKRQPFIGNLVVALLAGISIIIVDALFQTGNPMIFIYGLFAFFMTLIREMIKDMEDVRGDNTFGCRTLPIIWGLRKTKILIYAVMLIFAISVLVLNGYFGRIQFYYLLLLFFPLLFLFVKLFRADTKRNFSRLSLYCKMIMLMGILSMVFV